MLAQHKALSKQELYNRCSFKEQSSLISHENLPTKSQSATFEVASLFSVAWQYLISVNKASPSSLLYKLLKGKHQGTVDCLTQFPQLFNDFLMSKDSKGSTPLHYAALSGDLGFFESIHDILKSQAYIHRTSVDEQFGLLIAQSDRFGNCIMHTVCEAQQNAVAKYLYTSFPNAVSKVLFTPNKLDESTSIHHACRWAMKAILAWFLHKFSQKAIFDAICAIDQSGNTPIHEACNYHNSSILTKLIKPFVNDEPNLRYLLNLKNKQLQSPIHKACANDHVEVFEYISDKLDSSNLLLLLTSFDHFQNTPIHVACTSASSRTIEFLCKSHPSTMGSTLSIPNENGSTPVHIACKVGIKPIIHCLCSQLTSDQSELVLLTPDNFNNTPIHYCRQTQRDDFLTHFCQALPHKTSIKLISLNDSWDKSTVHIACECGLICFLTLLIQSFSCELEIALTQPDESGNTPFHLACLESQIQVVHLLCKFLTEQSLYECIKKKNMWNKSVFFLACESDCQEIVEQLCVSINSSDLIILFSLTDSTRNTAFHSLCRNNQQKTANYLCQQFPRLIAPLLTKQNSWDESPLQLAAYAGLNSMVECACTYSNKTQVTKIISSVVDRQSNTIIHEICRSGHSEVITVLCQKFPDLMTDLLAVRNSNGQTAGDVARISGSNAAYYTCQDFLTARNPCLPAWLQNHQTNNIKSRGQGEIYTRNF